MAHRRKIEYSNFGAAAQGKSMWVGDKTAVEQPVQLYDGGAICTRKILISEALPVTVNELLTNALDMHTLCAGAPAAEGGPVTRISCSITPRGVITVSNNGPGFPVVYNAEEKMWSVEAAFTREHTGSSISEDPYRITGGTNGLGLKLVNHNCLRLEVQTYDAEREQMYVQVYTCSTGSTIIAAKPVITAVRRNAVKPEHCGTTVVFTPNYDLLCSQQVASLAAANTVIGSVSTAAATSWLTPANLANFTKVLHLRMLQIATWIGSATYVYSNPSTRIEYTTPCTVLFQGKPVTCTLPKLGELLCSGPQHTIALDSGDAAIMYPWMFSISLAPPNTKQPFTNLLNGMFVTHSPGTALMIRNLAREVAEHHAVSKRMAGLGPEEAKKLRDEAAGYIANMLYCTNRRTVPNPQFNGQTKDKIPISPSALKPYKFPASYVADIWSMVKERFERQDLAGDLKRQAENIAGIKVTKHEKAEIYGRQHSAEEFAKMTLFLGEGDAALLLIRTIIVQLKLYKYYGTYSLGGVPPNVLKQIRDKIGDNAYIMSDMLSNNTQLQGLVKILGLEYERDYTSIAAYRKLKYSRILIGTDQDADGIGQIGSLVVLFIAIFWPQLFAHGFVCRWDTPIVRVPDGKTPDGKVRMREFVDETEYETWAAAHPGVRGKYYKGLAGHRKAEIVHMAKNFGANIYTYTLDSAYREACEVMYGRDSAPRKAEHMRREIAAYGAELRSTKQIPISIQMYRYAKIFQREMYCRKLPNVLDGMIPVQRMSFACLRKAPGTELKIYQWSGRIADDFKYAHGDMSLNGTIIKMAQTFPGTNVLPKFVPLGSFGGVKYGRGVAGSPRYIDTQLNAKLMNIIFPVADDELLPRVTAEGKVTEPKYYIPIVPLAILETCTTAAAGWNVSAFARDLNVVLAALKLRILSGDAAWPGGHAAGIWSTVEYASSTPVAHARSNDGELCEVGIAQTKLIGNTLVVTGLPTKLWSNHVRCNLLGLNIKEQTRAAKAELAKASAGKATRKGASDAAGSAALHGSTKAAKTQLPADIDTGSLPYSATIADVYDRSDDADYCIHIVFRPGAIAAIQNMAAETDGGDTMYRWGDRIPGVGALEEYCGLYTYMHKRLNMLDNDIVHEFQSYAEVAEYWYTRRLELYQTRYDRQSILLQLQLQHARELLRYINAANAAEIQIGRDFSNEQRIRILEQHKFQKFNVRRLNNPKGLRNSELEHHITRTSTQPCVDKPGKNKPAETDDDDDSALPGPIDYDYIDSVQERHRSKAGIVDLVAKIAKLEEQLDDHLNMTPKRIWLRELDQILPTVAEGRSSDWTYKKTEVQYE